MPHGDQILRPRTISGGGLLAPLHRGGETPDGRDRLPQASQRVLRGRRTLLTVLFHPRNPPTLPRNRFTTVLTTPSTGFVLSRFTSWLQDNYRNIVWSLQAGVRFIPGWVMRSSSEIASTDRSSIASWIRRNRLLKHCITKFA